jgi:hypothetical protein
MEVHAMTTASLHERVQALGHRLLTDTSDEVGYPVQYHIAHLYSNRIVLINADEDDVTSWLEERESKDGEPRFTDKAQAEAFFLTTIEQADMEQDLRQHLKDAFYYVLTYPGLPDGLYTTAENVEGRLDSMKSRISELATITWEVREGCDQPDLMFRHINHCLENLVEELYGEFWDQFRACVHGKS